MSLSREAAKEICGYIKEHCATLFGQKFFECRLVKAVQVQSGSKADKFESKFFALAKFRVFLLHGKHTGSLKVEKCFNLLALRQIQVVKESETGLTIGWEVDKSGRTASVFIRLADEKEATDLACELLAALKHYFPDIRDSLTHLITQLSPPTLMSLFAFLPTSTPDLPCHNFRRSYVAYCDFHDQPFKDEVVWDVERIYFVHNIREIRLDDFSHLSVKDQVAILGCIQFSSYFTGIYVDGFRLSPEHLEVVLNVCRRSHALKSLKLVSCGLPKEYVGQLAAALQANYERLPLECLDLSGNNLDDKKSIAQLASALARIHTLKSIILMDCSLSEKSVHQLSFGLYTGLGMDTSIGKKFELQTLVLARNSLKDDANELVNFVSLCNSLRTLDLSHTGFHVDRLWSALKLGGLLLERLKLGGCQTHVGKKSSSRDSHHQQPVATVVKELFTSMVNLKKLEELNLSDCRLGSYLSVVLNALGVASLKSLDISGNDIGNIGARLLSKALQLNNSLKKVSVDRNQIGPDGLAELAHALELNYCLTSMPIPFLDITDAINNKSVSADRVRMTGIVGDIESNLERNRNITTEQLAKQCRQKTVHNIINRTDHYSANSSEQKKAIFYNLAKCIVELDDKAGTSSPQTNLDLSEYLSSQGLIRGMVQQLKDYSQSYSGKYLKKFKDALDARNVEVLDEAQSVLASLDSEDLDELERNLKTIAEAHFTRSAWNTIFKEADSLLSSNDLLKLRGALPSDGPIDTSLHAAILGRGGTPAGAHRPNSVLDESLLASLASADLNSIDGMLTGDEAEGRSGRQTPKLVHLSKGRPRPARQNRNVRPVRDSPGFSGDCMDTPPPPPSYPPPPEPRMETSVHSSQDHSSASSSVEPSNGGQNTSGSAEPISINTSSPTPPPLIPRRNKVGSTGSSGGPPKLPPKPESSGKSPTDLRNHKTLVLPAFDMTNPASPKNNF
ncbi:protein CARMIL [Ditylenchus destructor]|nr:protein CARMIL [Ditylenchus destructor]